MLELSDSIGTSDAIVPVWNAGTRAKICARQGDRDALTVAEGAVTLSKRTDHINEQAGALLDLGTVALQLGQDLVASRVLATAAGLYTKKGNAVMASRVFALKNQCGS
jgi:hypothetical protein